MSLYDEQKILDKFHFNAGACILTPVWCVFHGQPIQAALLAVLWVFPHFFPFGSVLSIILKVFLAAFSLYYGFKGNAIAMESGAYRNEAEMLFVQRRWATWGLIIIVLYFAFAHVFYAIFAGFHILNLGMEAIIQ